VGPIWTVGRLFFCCLSFRGNLFSFLEFFFKFSFFPLLLVSSLLFAFRSAPLRQFASGRAVLDLGCPQTWLEVLSLCHSWNPDVPLRISQGVSSPRFRFFLSFTYIRASTVLHCFPCFNALSVQSIWYFTYCPLAPKLQCRRAFLDPPLESAG